MRRTDQLLEPTPIAPEQFDAHCRSLGFPDFGLPHQWTDPVYALTEAVFYSEPKMPCPLYDIGFYLRRAMQEPDLTPYFAFGVDGHGVFSQAIHLYLKKPPIAVFLQFPWPADLDDESRSQIENAFCAVDLLMEPLEKNRGKLSNQLLVVTISHIAGSGFAWSPMSADSEPDWNQEDPTLCLALLELEKHVAEA